MRLSNLVTLSLMGVASAAPARHHQHIEKRDAVTTTVKTQVTVTQGITGQTNALLQEDAVVGTTAAAAVAVAAAAGTTSTLEPSSAAGSSSSSGSSPSSSVTAGNAKGITYSPYASDGTCKSASDVASDLAQLTSYGIIRLYGVDCSQVENVLKAKASSQKLFLGIYYVDQIADGVSTIKNAVESYGSWDDISTVSVGNELVNGGEASTAQVGEYISTARSALTAAGYTGSVVSVDTFIAVINNPDLCNYSDYMAVNAHAYFDENTTAENAGPWVLEQIQRVWTACGGKKDVLITESGWPSQGQTYGLAVPSEANQKTAISSIEDTCGSATILFTAFNDYWKADGAYGVEKYFGILSD
ncbi:similar to Saccharomyces cerevisiae YGR279C SCW4 Cell wall protein with similarity to glucanases [Maudiozyma barnettii]|mgnify:CR=1 FL=1|uniref:Similar to Saccharomyces cerevisiae YGR279C SCW4 Cell wall protein with similarity to glucanases n=1 Tax=Maudiozyma barnettii TaxID=61262 RepID=A0A8H2VD00_9SACH|nr:uncharacterized protein KABA2_02S10252 [Kazachstania barnettii]CAB4253036.1 similar to Saccharomyces cerevisiae YGR279C SCW4 Cell wall protein with similarity to glucanases [Kazachstania barnettii]CAD1780429.1 similar to Saccharomyces cerevisiae YGR279C SCW4 Cell wall protein with similarity to glucanases [Kazachstania barnettii]